MIPLFKPYMPQLPLLNEILMSGKLTSGEYTRAFEESLKKYFNEKYILVTKTFGSAVSVVAATLGLTFGDEILISPMGCLVSTQPYAAAGLKLKWCDVDPHRGTLSPDFVRKAATSKTKAIVHNHYCGYPGYIDEINEIGKELGIPVIDDGIECFGSEYKNKKIGNCGTDVTIFALSAVRIPNTVDGGIIIFKSPEHYKKASRIRDCGINRASFRDELGEINPNCDIFEIGCDAVMSNVNAYIGLQQMEKVPNLLSAQKANALIWDKRFHDKPGVRPIYSKDIAPNYWVYGLLAQNKVEIIKEFRNKGYYASGVHMRNDIYSAFGKQNVELHGVDEFYKSFVALPCGWWIE